MTQTTFTDNVLIDGSQDIPQLTVEGHSTQIQALQTWQDSADTPFTKLTGDGRLQVGDFEPAGTMATDDALIEAHRSDTSSKPKRGLHTLGRIGGAVSDAITWAVQELELLGIGGVTSLQTALRARIVHKNTGTSTTAELRAGDFEATNETGTTGARVGKATGVRAAVRNLTGAFLQQAIGAEITVENPGTITDAYGLKIADMPSNVSGSRYALYSGTGTARFGDNVVVDGAANVAQLTVQAHSTQTNPVFVVEDSAGNDQFTVAADGSIVVNAQANPANFLIKTDTADMFYVHGATNRIAIAAGAITPTANLQVEGSVVFNENSNDVDIRFESNNDANNFFSDGGNDNIGIGTGTPNASAKLAVSSTTKGMLIPSMTAAQRDAIASPSTGLEVYNTDSNRFNYYDSAKWTPVDIPIKVKNTSGATANPADVGYINNSNEYKTTTTANDKNMVPGGCIVLVGGANNADIYVIRRGRARVTLTANCSIGDYLFSSTTAGRLAPSTTMRPELVAIAQTANASGAGGTCEALLYTGTVLVPYDDANELFGNNVHSNTDFAGTINSGGSGGLTTTNVPYNVTSGDEDVMSPVVATQLACMRLYNYTRGGYRLIRACDTVNNKITTEAQTDSWANGDVISPVSAYVTTGLAYKAIDLDLQKYTSYPPLARMIYMRGRKIDTAAAKINCFVMPRDTYAASKNEQFQNNVTNQFHFHAPFAVPLIEKCFSFAGAASGTHTAAEAFSVAGFYIATP